MTSTLLSAEPTNSATTIYRASLRRAFIFMIGLLGLVATAPLSAQTYSCFPTCSTTDARFLSIAGTGYNTLINSEIVMKIGSPGVATSIEIGIFDGETGGMWDAGTTPLTYNLYADPTGEGTGTTLVTTLPYTSMADNAWATFTVTNVASARAANGNYLYRLVIASTSTTDNYWSSFKIRTTGTVALKAQAFSVAATARTDADLNVIYPSGQSNLSTTTYDGTWHLFLDVQSAASTLSVWDGDMDFGSYDCSNNDVDDANTPNNVLPNWASPSSATLEGLASGSPCVGVSGYATGTPPDDNRYGVYRRSPAVNYAVITPQGQQFVNSNPSGGKEWEEFKLTTSAHNANVDDTHADSLTAGIYEVRVTGMDVDNLNGWRFFSDAIGVNVDGNPTPPLRPFSIGGTISFEAAPADEDNGNGNGNGNNGNGNGNNGNGNNGNGNNSTSTTSVSGSPIANAQVVLTGDVNGDNVNDVTLTATSNSAGEYSFPSLLAGSYHVTVVTSTLPSGAIASNDYDGVSTANTAAVVITSTGTNPGNVFFDYTLNASTTGTGSTGTRTQGYWKTHSSAWPSNSIMIGCTTYTKAVAIDKMNTSVSGDKTYSMFVQLVAAKLNVAMGATSSCIASTISAAETWLCTYRLGSNVGGTSSAWTNSGSALHEALDDYNNGRSCAPHVN